ncbi:molecular chaperone HtpG [Pelagibaculum spongiae]|uniref:Chaperone protein HtpG n=1 Tax=Pelagibaculum spongiae TaxID=2080658 RepID=A0A2V1GPM7_9GAMM|nr:molecular chaperone HtpG [Pelagibaculum spongiae]PVZ64976.1 molecular chaperone HtpG [Pelagibaculum spongiae]
MTVEAQKETLGFQAEVKQLLHLMVHSLYSNREIFLRELISNSSDAVDKLRFEALEKPELMGSDSELNIRVSIDSEAGTLTISDNGIGMDRDEVINNLGTIANSGTRKFLENMTGDQASDSGLIGQFGVGFYSSFIVADEVKVITRRADAAEDQAVMWDSTADGEFTVEYTTRSSRGTDIILLLKDDQKEFLDSWKVRQIISKYADHISLPVIMKGEPELDEEGKETKPAEDEVINKATALWTRSKSDISEDEYKEFYKHVSHDFDEPLTWSHNKVEGKLEYTSLLFLPKRAPFDLWQREAKHGLKLFVQRVFIMDDAEQFMPTYLRFVRGIIDSNDLPLNVSRELLQDSKVIDSIRSASTKKVLDMMKKLAKNQPEEYQAFWDTFGKVLKEGPAEDMGNKEKIAALLRFASTETGEAVQNVALANYIERMKEGQDKIYYVAAESHAAASNSPHIEIFKKKGIEVLLLSDPIDEWLMSHLTDFDGKEIVSVARGALDLDKMEEEKQTDEQKAEKEAGKKAKQEKFESLTAQLTKLLENEASEVRLSERLTDSPACLVADENSMTSQMERLMRSAGQEMPKSKPILEINPDHPLVSRLQDETDDAVMGEWAQLLLGQATLAEGGHLDDPAGFVRRMNQMLMK